MLIYWMYPGPTAAGCPLRSDAEQLFLDSLHIFCLFLPNPKHTETSLTVYVAWNLLTHLVCSALPRTALSSSSRTTKIRWSRPARRRQTDASSRETTRSTESLPRPQRRRTNGSTASSEPRLNSDQCDDDDDDDAFLEVLLPNPPSSSTYRAAISKDPFYEMLAARKKKVSSLKGL